MEEELKLRENVEKLITESPPIKYNKIITKEAEARYYQDKATLDTLKTDLCTSQDLEILRVLPENYLRWYEEKNKPAENDDLERIREAYDLITMTINKYLDIKPEYCNIISLWIIGTYFHKDFNSYPYLFINAMKGSGKSRLMQLIKHLSKNGEVIMSLTDAVLFRSDNDTTMCIDEFEDLASKERGTLRVLLNACYKKGTSVKRMRKIKTIDGEKQVPEEFSLYRPLALANINGMEEVLGDRCINIFLEKSRDKSKTILIENFEHEDTIKQVKILLNGKKGNFYSVLCRVCNVMYEKNNLLDIYSLWNNYVCERYNIHTIHNIHTYNTYTTTYTTQDNTLHIPLKIKLDKIFNKIVEANIDGRSFELHLPLFFIASAIDEKNFNETIKFCSLVVEQKDKDDLLESKDIMLYDFVSTRLERFNEYRIKDLTAEFRNFIDGDFSEMQNITSVWFGLALKRLSLVIRKTRDMQGIKVIIDIDKAKNKLKLFKEVDEEVLPNGEK